MLANYHTHTFRCNHASGEDREYVENAIKSGFSVLGFSDHCPWDFNNSYHSSIRMTPEQIDGYFSSLSDLKKEYADDITIYIGFEAEFIPELISGQEQLLKDFPLDYMIMGQHFFEHEMFGRYTGVPTNDPDMLRSYVDSIITGMKTGKYIYLAHPDLLSFTGDPLLYRSEFLRLCKAMKDNNIPLEINMLGLNIGRHYPCDQFFSIASEVGNSVIIGCDAHSPDSLLDSDAMNKCRLFAERHGLNIIDFIPGLGPAEPIKP